MTILTYIIRAIVAIWFGISAVMFSLSGFFIIDDYPVDDIEIRIVLGMSFVSLIASGYLLWVIK